ncbi:L-dopachrome tautomerase-related protein [Cytophagaceae bacterium DM2B3-1]|uniref:L-dopachrome tautomerase-related protein n=1 Tax=Xanthocytophaga flava TaxID=3048013 RepID=A0ABT7CYU8_9BACT|nr:L-dopachrome tautomerase-related protein [Xanthocytophaga flavus]MDJ1470156.1 L-dopachrome tautomerase-related protein [Xanthocytophaga flavus]MDJ1498932.1 L-dopachrome tautomerase-related protein [Xanthocytophaga flavus]
MKKLVALVIFLLNWDVYAQKKAEKQVAHSPVLETVAELPIRPGNVAVSNKGRVFATIHSLGSRNIQLIEIKGKNKYIPYPNDSYQKNEGPASDDAIDSPLGLIFDKKDRLWVIDMGQELGKTRLWCFDIQTNKVVRKITLLESIAPKGSFIQDLAIDADNDWAYMADISNPGIVALNLKTEKARRFGNAPQLNAEDMDMVINGKLIYFGGKPARVAVDPISLSADANTLFFGAMNGKTWYKLDASLFRKEADDKIVAASIAKAGEKPISDGATTDQNGNHYFTNLTQHAISKLDTKGKLTNIITDSRLKWPDNAYLASNGYIYIAVNQLNTTPAFTGGKDEGNPPYYIYRFRYNFK